MSAPPSRSDHTFGELVAALGERGQQLPSVYAAFGIAVPPLEAAIPVDEEQLLRRFFDVWAMVDDTPEVALRAAHIVGDGMRRIAAATLDLFDEHGGSPPDRLKRGLSHEEAMRPSFVLPPLQRDLLEWLRSGTRARGVRAHRGLHGASAREADGRSHDRSTCRRSPSSTSPATRSSRWRAATSGRPSSPRSCKSWRAGSWRSRRARRQATRRWRPDPVRVRHRGGRRRPRARPAIVDAGLPAAHAGIAVGRFVVRDGDVYGNVVNLASRIAAQAQAGEVLLPIDDARELLPASRLGRRGRGRPQGHRRTDRPGAGPHAG